MRAGMTPPSSGETLWTTFSAQFVDGAGIALPEIIRRRKADSKTYAAD
jgi:hypothetical protein